MNKNRSGNVGLQPSLQICSELNRIVWDQHRPIAMVLGLDFLPHPARLRCIPSGPGLLRGAGDQLSHLFGLAGALMRDGDPAWKAWSDQVNACVDTRLGRYRMVQTNPGTAPFTLQLPVDTTGQPT